MKNKIFFIIFLSSAGIFLNSCDKRLDIAPLNILTSEYVMSDENAVNAYLASLYGAALWENFTFTGASYLGNCTDEAINCYTDQVLNIGNGTNTQWWGYSAVRNVNDLIAKLPDSKISLESKTKIMGEAKFLRAYYYFSMVKRYGGVPIIKDVQTFTGDNLQALQIPRNTEKEVYDFIAEDLDEAVTLLPETNVKGRANKYAAYALKSRAMLYAASIAKYGTVQLNGLVGIPASDANYYWEASYDAAEAIINSGKYSLYKKNSDLTANFQQLFLDRASNPEEIFLEYYLYGYKTHTWDCMMLPRGLKGPSGFAARMNPTLDLVEEFEYIDGSPGILNVGTPSSPVLYPNPLDLFKNKDPRCLATVIVPQSTFKGLNVDIKSGLYDLGVKIEAGDYATLYNPVTHQVDNLNGTIHVVGDSGPPGNETTQTGFNLKKYLDPNLPQSMAINSTTAGSTQAWIVFRYAEVLLNYAEAAVELGRIADAKAKINLIRSRAGIVTLDDANITIDRVRKERNVELAFENHRWWDYRRWRISESKLTNWWPRMLKPYFDLDNNAWRFEIANAGRYAKTFSAVVYYERIDPSEITKNPKLVQNPGY